MIIKNFFLNIMYFKRYLFILIFSFCFGYIISYNYKINNTIIIYPNLYDNNIYIDDNMVKYKYQIIN